MNGLVFAFLVIVAALVARGFRYWLHYQERMRDRHVDASATELEALRRRVETLEAIVTDEGWSVRREIDRLDERPQPKRAAGG